MTQEQKIIRAKVGLLELAKQLGNVSQAGKMMGYSRDGTVNLSGRVSRMQTTGSGRWGLLPTHATDFGPYPKFLGSGSSMLGGRAVISAEVEEVIDLIVG